MNASLRSIFILLMLLIVGCTAENATITPTVVPRAATEASNEDASPTDTARAAASATELEESPTRRATNTPRASTEAATDSPTESCVPRSDWFAYTIRAGDTLGRIALAANTTVAILQTANCLSNVNAIITGQRLFVPVQNLIVPTATATATLTYTPTVTLTPNYTPTACTINPNLPRHQINSQNIQDFGQGTTLINGIAMSLGVTPGELLSANCLSEAQAASIGSGTVLSMPGTFDSSEFDFDGSIIGEEPTDCLDNC